MAARKSAAGGKSDALGIDMDCQTREPGISILPRDDHAVAGPLAALVVDDDPIIRQVLVECLKLHGIKAAEAGNGFECLSALEKSHFDVIFMDIVMPEKDGIETIIELRKRGNKSWIVAISAYTKIGDKLLLEAAKIFGANDAINKPFSAAMVVQDVKSLMERMNSGIPPS
jgi:CheY-like chemotaxis protein